MKIFSVVILIFILLGGCSSNLNIEDGRVLDAVTNEPITDAFVVVNGHYRHIGGIEGMSLCRTEIVKSNNLGYFNIDGVFTVLPKKYHTNEDKRVVTYVYKPNYQKAERSIIDSAKEYDKWFTNLGNGVDTDRASYTPIKYLKKNINNREQRLRYLYSLYNHAICDYRDSKRFISYYDALIKEASELVSTDYDQYLLSKMIYKHPTTNGIKQPKLTKHHLLATVGDATNHSGKTFKISEIKFIYEPNGSIVKGSIVKDSIGGSPVLIRNDGCSLSLKSTAARRYNRGGMIKAHKCPKIKINIPYDNGSYHMPANTIINVQYIDERNEKDQTRLMAAAESGNDLQRLILLGADPNKRTFRGKTALDFANSEYDSLRYSKSSNKSSKLNRALKSINLLTQAKNINLEMILSTGHTALTYAVYKGDINTVSKLLDAGANPNTLIYKHSSYSQTALGTALSRMPLFKMPATSSEGPYNTIADMIIWAKGFDPNVKIKGVLTPLRVFASKGRPEIIRKLLNLGGDPNIGVKENPVWGIAATPLGSAVMTAIKHPKEHQYTDVVTAFLEPDDINVDEVTFKGMTALELARANKRKDLVDIIEKRRNKSQ